MARLACSTAAAGIAVKERGHGAVVIGRPLPRGASVMQGRHGGVELNRVCGLGVQRCQLLVTQGRLR